MRRALLLIGLASVVVSIASGQSRSLAPPTPLGVRLEDLTWPAAEQRFSAETVVVLPVGAAAQEHGLHLRLRNDYTLAEYLTRRIIELTDVVAAPTLPYHYYPAFNEYPGSTSLSLNTARDVTADLARSIARHGPRRFYALNVGASSQPALAAAAKVLAGNGILLHFTDWQARIDALRALQQQAGGSHADEIETSMMLYIDPSTVTMANAMRDFNRTTATPFQLTRRPGGTGTYSPTGAWGDPTVATREKGRGFVDALVAAIHADVEVTRRAVLPVGSLTTTEAPPPRPAVSPTQGGVRMYGDCLPGDDRSIREIGVKFYNAWLDQNPDGIVSLWGEGGDMAHPDGLVESTPQVIKENRAYLFRQREFNGSKHFLTIGTIRCVTHEVAVADCKWELRGVTDGRGNHTPPAEGLCTLVLKRRGGGWGIEAWRYNMKPASAATQPTILNKPGFPRTIR